ncbi:hypothetical protein TPB0596_11070 [Tsukamurella pulmonis]|nr:hypothetical protein TPB0596_11070 [Tsukamurella pulmonis]
MCGAPSDGAPATRRLVRGARTAAAPQAMRPAAIAVKAGESRSEMVIVVVMATSLAASGYGVDYLRGNAAAYRTTLASRS